jgi:ADP-heptose:LPS heptosyltransferase/glycosyltransferase involved in cell wall biosynthesis
MMKKLRTLLKAPVLTQSGYGVHSRQILNALLKDPVFDVYVENINWGACSFLTEDTEEKRTIRNLMEKRIIEKYKGQDRRFDVFIHVTIPNEFEKQGVLNIGVTAGIETDRVSHVWVEKCNEMDLVVVPSEHSKKTLVDSTFQWQNQQTGEQGTLRLTKPIVVCSEGVDTSVFYPNKEAKSTVLEVLNDLPEFNFLHVGQWGRGGYGEDRKNIALLTKYFIETFKGRKDVGLILKVNMARNSVIDYANVEKRLKEIKSNYKESEVPPIFLLHANFTNEEMAALYNHPKVSAMISLTHGEGFGLPLLEAAACGLPILATNWSGHLDFLKLGKFGAIEYDLKEIPDAAVWENILIKGSKWAEVKEQDVKSRMQKIVSAYDKPKEWATELSEKVRNELSLEKVGEKFTTTVKQHLIKDKAAQIDPLEHLESFVDTPDAYNVLYTMPMSTGDVFISTAVIDGLVKELPADHKIYFATNPQYFDLLKGNPHIYKVIPWNESMVSMDLTEEVFDLVLTPNIATQFTFSNWVRRGQGRLLAEEFANHCNTKLGDYHIQKDPIEIDADLRDGYMTFHPGSGRGQWESRRYSDWPEVLSNLKTLYPKLKIVQVGSADEPKFDGVDVDLRGKTTYQQLATVIQNSSLHLSIDTFTMHLAAAEGTPLVALFGCSYATSTGPWVKNKDSAKYILLQSDRVSGCSSKACYKNRCVKNPENPPINEIDPKQVVASCSSLLGTAFGNEHKTFNVYPYKRIYGKISGYTTTYNAMDYPFLESIQSMLGFCDEVVVVDGSSTDGTREKLDELASKDSRIKVFENTFDWEEPGMDGMQKAFARALCENEYLWQMDCDEVVHEDDYEKIKMITKRFPSQDILHLPVIELWGNEGTFTGRRHCWKWRMSRNKPEITHAINKHARVTDEKTGKVFAKKGMSDGCEYVNAMTYEMLPHTGFYNDQIEIARTHLPQRYGEGINEVFRHLPSIYHYSWCSLERKINQLKKGGVWDRMWSLLYRESTQERFPGVETPEQVRELAQKLYDLGGEESDTVKYKCQLNRSNPAVMKDWLSRVPLIK